MPDILLLETAIYARDLEAARQFYEEILQLPFYSRKENRHVFFKLGNGMLLIFNPNSTREEGGLMPPHGVEGACHVAFAVPESKLDCWRTRLQQYHIDIEQEITWPGGGRSLYFRDPAGNSVEITTPKIWRYSEAHFWKANAQESSNSP